jgi:hypothetical protein
MQEDFLFTILRTTTQNNRNIPKKKYMFNFLKLKRAKKFVWGLPNGFFFPGSTKILSCPLKIYQNIPNKTKFNQN